MNPNMQTALSNDDKIHRVVLAGMKLMYDPKTLPMLVAGITRDAPMSQKLAMETVGIMHIIDQKTKDGIPPEVVAPAAIMLMFDLAQFMKQSEAGDPTKEDMQAALPILQKVLLKVFTEMGKGATGGQQPQQPQQPQQGGLIQQGV